MDIDPSERCLEKVETLRSITAAGSLSSSVAKLSGSSRGIPSQKDFYFYANFEKFKTPVKEIDGKSKAILKNLGASSQLWGKSMQYPETLDSDDPDLYDWLVNVNDDIFEKIDASLDEFRNLRKREVEGSGAKLDMDSDGGFQVVRGKKNRKGGVLDSNNAGKEVQGVQVATKVKPKIPFHLPNIPRPQDEYKIIVNNTNQPFEHVWLQKSEDGSRFIHPLEKLSFMDFVDKSVPDIAPIELEHTPFKLVEDVKDLKQLAAKLRCVDEFAVDLEHNQYRSFQGLTCLMQISTRTEDFVIDTLRLRIHIGPYLREIFKDPTKRKVMHGADKDILWLQKDFGIYVCNLFDTGQASRVLKLDRHSLEYLLFYYCGVIANKEYQNADWRLRPLPDDMLRYAREDTHYLLRISDMMKGALLSQAKGSDALLIEVYKRSYDICMQLYEKELLTDSSYLHIYGLQGSGFNAQQVAVVYGLYEWRDIVARAEDESTGYILPNRSLLEIAKQMPFTTSKLQRLVKSKHPYVECNLGSIVNIIRQSVQNYAAFEAASEQLKGSLSERASGNASASEGPEVLPNEDSELVKNAAVVDKDSINNVTNVEMPGSLVGPLPCKENLEDSGPLIEGGGGNCQNFPECLDKDGSKNHDIDSVKLGETAATVPVLRKPSRAFGALLGASSKRKFHTDKKEPEDLKLEQIKSTVNLPFHSFAGNNECQQLVAVEPSMSMNKSNHSEPIAESSNVEDIIQLRSGSDLEESGDGGMEGGNDQREKDNTGSSAPEVEGEEPMSLSDLHTSFQKCFQSSREIRKSNRGETSHASEGALQRKPFDYESTKDIMFGEDHGEQLGTVDDDGSRMDRRQKGSRKNSAVMARDEGTKEFAPGRRRQAFPASGNRSATFR